MTCCIFDTPQVKWSYGPHLKALSSGDYKPRGQSCGSTLNICQGVLKSAILLSNWGCVKPQLIHTVNKENLHIQQTPNAEAQSPPLTPPLLEHSSLQLDFELSSKISKSSVNF